MRSPLDPTPYDSPSTLWERITFPALADAYRQGVEDSRERTRFDVSIARVTRTPFEADDIRNAALNLAKLGVNANDVEPMARLWFTEPQHILHDIDRLKATITARYASTKGEPE